VIVTARNEAHRLPDKLENLLALPKYSGELDLIVASDASTDATDDIVRSYAPCGIRLIRSNQRLGKENAQRLAVREARGDILVFSDVGTHMKGPVFEAIAECFLDPDVGAISSRDVLLAADGTMGGESLYVRYEMWLRSQESRVSSLIGLSGSFFAARYDICCVNWPIDLPSDFMAALTCVEAGKVAVLAPHVVGFYPDLSDPAREYHRKLRTILRGMRTLARNAHVLSPFRYGLFAYQLWSHKVLRWLTPWFLLLLFATTAAASYSHGLYLVPFFGQVTLVGLAVLSLFAPGLRRYTFFRLLAYFTQANVAAMHAAVHLILGRNITTWSPSDRAGDTSRSSRS
jgi:hypothetical protein